MSAPRPSPSAPGGAATQRIPRADSTVPPADRLGPYRLVQVIGEGGMGVVHLGVDPRGRAVAIKVLRDHVAQDPDSRARLAREVTTLSRIRHPRVAPVLDADTAGPRPYVVTRYVPGTGLDEAVRDDGPFRGDALVRLGRGLAEALDAIHAAGIVHRDLKPGNVLLVDGDPVVIDFGIAHVADDVRLTMTGLVMGTPGYLSPEVVRGGSVTPSTDWWGWAATMTFAATGRPPFGKGPMHVVLDRVRDGEPDLDGLDPRLADLLLRALAPEPADRPDPRELVAGVAASAGADPTIAIATPAVPTQPVRLGDTAPQPLDARPGVPTGRADAGVPRPAAPAAGSPAPSTPPPAWSAPAPTASPVPSPTAPAVRPVPAWSPQAHAPHAPGPHTEAPAPAVPQVHPDEAPARPRPTLGDPRLGRPGRTGPLTVWSLAVAALAATWPVLALAIALAWSVVARTSDRVITATVVRRHTYGSARRSDGVVAALASPLHVVTAVLSTALAAVLAAVVGASGAFLTSVLAAIPLGHPLSMWGAPALAVGALLAQWTAWWGPGGTSLRRGSRSIMRSLTPPGLGAELVTTGLGVVALALAVWSVMSHGVPSYVPYSPPGGTVPWQW